MSTPAPTSTSTVPAAAAALKAISSPVTVTKGDVVSIATWILLVTSSLAMIARLSTKWAVSRHLQLDDGFAILALLFHIGSGVAVTVLDRHGLGENTDNLSSAQRRMFAQSAFAADLLFIGTLCFAKLSIVLLFNNITRQKSHRILSYGCASFVAVWCAASLIGASFLCTAPTSWDLFGKCFHVTTFWYSFGAINVFTDVLLIIIPTIIVVPLRMTRSKKVMVLSCFGTRVCDIGASIALIVFTDTFSVSNFTSALWPWILTAQFVQCISIITSCIPYLKPLLEWFPSGMYGDEAIRKGTSTQVSSDGYIRAPETGFAMRPVDSIRSQKTFREFASAPDRHPTATILGRRLSNNNDLYDRRPLHTGPTSSSPDGLGIMKTTTTTVTSHR